MLIEGFAGGQTGFQANELLREFTDLKILRYKNVEAPGSMDRLKVGCLGVYCRDRSSSTARNQSFSGDPSGQRQRKQRLSEESFSFSFFWEGLWRVIASVADVPLRVLETVHNSLAVAALEAPSLKTIRQRDQLRAWPERDQIRCVSRLVLQHFTENEWSVAALRRDRRVQVRRCRYAGCASVSTALLTFRIET